MQIASSKTELNRPSAARKARLNPRLPRMGKVVFSEDGNAVHCAVKKFSREKAILVMSGWMGLPSDFTLYIEPDTIRANCTVVKRNGSNIEVEFSNFEEGVRYRAAS